jgi:ABC-type oligopeptide transport system ATPase subunit
MADRADTLLDAREVSKIYRLRGSRANLVRAVDDVSISVSAGESLGIVGESGSGKTTLVRLLLGIEKPTLGLVLHRGTPLPNLSPDKIRQYHNSVTAVFQSPYSSLDPRMRIWELITEQLFVQNWGSREEKRSRAKDLLDMVGLSARLLDQYAHQLSGGQRQRVAIARSIASNPEVVILDEPISALDVSVRAQIINLLLDLQDRLGFAYVFVAHDLAMVQHLCHRTIVMSLGRIVEQGESVAIFEHPQHSYTAALVAASYLGTAPVAEGPLFPARAITRG